tara:strand:- start:2553 stop:3548 length:996 start_codon:yes stop_codon:yes gene_type:complete
MEKYKCKKCNIVKDLTLEYFIKTSIKNIKNEIKTGNPYCKICQKEMRKNLQCKHGKRKYRCLECGGHRMCMHKRQKHTCKLCGGKSRCKHGRLNFRCIECNGASICKHKKAKQYCIDCNGTGIDKTTGKSKYNLCKSCNYTLGIKRYVSKEKKYVKMCADCFYNNYPNEKKVPSRFKRKQHFINEKLIETYGSNFFEYDRTISCSSSGKIPDWFYDTFTHVLNIECDEEQHKSRDTSCENKRLMLLFKDCGNRPFVCLRFNPDKYKDENGNKINGCFSFDEVNNLIVDEKEFQRRWEKLQIEIDYFLKTIPTKEVTVKKLFYDIDKSLTVN